MNIWWRDTEGNLVNASVSPDFDVYTEAPKICPRGVLYIIAENSQDLDWSKPTGYGKGE